MTTDIERNEDVSAGGRLAKLEATMGDTAGKVDKILKKVSPSLGVRLIRFTFRLMVIGALAMVYNNSTGENPISLDECTEHFDQQSGRAANIRALVERLEHAQTDEDRAEIMDLLKTLTYDAELGSELIIRRCAPISIPHR